ncbi:3'(2'),5'-bisphosphate nucleotidase CysQ [Acinetobacter qingfengensis]|uniref:3'(2'),5'-bisphosphate nucleotidase CysQ n=1 Tax=Acinetobacter qingfengensis TaxID=1262585 RepID=A0A1E7REM8_9GAMM|nr:3'(2'),5'-bisphosphate nucleotidase CysQ [Acinetobacter qingfengensis]KAA8734377.1 3'(2'),5'-bisphosphate nucleotidase CysQ [Acinetobacter qingfengensis]OEY97615.1 hypothetical protein BJI46_09040 [Acinetobacter qingfengensis]
MFIEVALQQMPEKLQQLCQILQRASELLEQEYQDYIAGAAFEIQQKADQSPVTQADLKCNAMIQSQLQHITPQLPILSEEGEHQLRHQWSQFWMLDPLDGTKEFLHQTGEFTINLSLIDQGESVISALAVPLQHKIYITQKDLLPFRWQWHQEKKVIVTQYQRQFRYQETLRIAMSRRPERSPIYAEFLTFLEQHHINYQKIMAGSAYKFCMMLEDQIDIYPRFHPTCEWDTAAGQGLLKSIGGEVYSLKHQPFYYNQRKQLLNGNFIALRYADDWQKISQFIALLSRNN